MTWSEREREREKKRERERERESGRVERDREKNKLVPVHIVPVDIENVSATEHLLTKPLRQR